MKGSQKILLLIVGVTILLVVAAFAFVLLQPEPVFVAEDTADGVVHNYLLALRRDDYERAYTYISKNSKVGDLENFIESAEGYRYFDVGSDVTLAIQEIRESSDDSVSVKVLKTQTFNELVGSRQYSNTFSMRLKKNDGEWKIVDGDQYWDYCWDLDSDCR